MAALLGQGPSADALNRLGLGHIMISALRSRLSQPTDMASRPGLQLSSRYNPDEPRDWHGRWTTGGGIARKAQPVPAGLTGPWRGLLDPIVNRAPTAADRSGGLLNFVNWPNKPAPIYGNPQVNRNDKASVTHAEASMALAKRLANGSNVEAVYMNQKLSTITGGAIKSGIQPDVTVKLKDGTIQPYEIPSGRQTSGDLKLKYRNIESNILRDPEVILRNRIVLEDEIILRASKYRDEEQ